MKLITELFREKINNQEFDKENLVYFKIMVMDFYKKSVFEHHANFDDIDNYLIDCLLNKNEEYFIEFAQTNEILFNKLVNASKWFSKLSILDKQQVMGIIKFDNNFSFVVKNNPILFLESVFYNPSFDKGSILYYYKNYIDTYGREIDKQNMALNILIEYLDEIKYTENNLYYENMLEAIKEYYQTKKFLSINNSALLFDDDIWYLKFIEENSIDAIMMFSKTDDSFMPYILGEYLYSSVTENELADDIKQFVKVNIPKSLKEKLEIKN